MVGNACHPAPHFQPARMTGAPGPFALLPAASRSIVACAARRPGTAADAHAEEDSLWHALASMTFHRWLPLLIATVSEHCSASCSLGRHRLEATAVSRPTAKRSRLAANTSSRATSRRRDPPVRGENANPSEDSEPVAIVPQSQASFAVTITAGPGSEGVWTVWA